MIVESFSLIKNKASVRILFVLVKSKISIQMYNKSLITLINLIKLEFV
jgi:hypothetical protein